MKRIAVLAACLALATAAVAEGQPPNLVAAGACGGYNAIGGGAEFRRVFGPGFTAGIAGRLLVPAAGDAVVGLTVSQGFLVIVPTLGWTLELPPDLSFFAGIHAGAEYSWLEERVLDPGHGIDSAYASREFMFEGGIALGIAWSAFGNLGVSGSVLVSVVDLRKTTGMIGLSLGW